MKLLRNYIIVLSVVAVIAVAFAAMAVMGYLTKADQAVVAPADPLAVNMEEEGDESLLRLLEIALDNSTRLEALPFPAGTAAKIAIQTRTDGGILAGAYSLHVASMINRNAVLEDLQTGSYYQLSIRDFSALLSHKAFRDLPEQRFFNPSVSLEDTTWSESVSLQPASQRIRLYTAEGSFKERPAQATEDPKVLILTAEEASQNPIIQAVPTPDAWSLSVTENGTMYLSQSRVSGQELFFPSEPGIYTYTLTAHWDLTVQRDWYGDASYVLEIHITEPEPPQDLPERTEGETSD